MYHFNHLIILSIFYHNISLWCLCIFFNKYLSYEFATYCFLLLATRNLEGNVSHIYSRHCLSIGANKEQTQHGRVPQQPSKFAMTHTRVSVEDAMCKTNFSVSLHRKPAFEFMRDTPFRLGITVLHLRIAQYIT